MAERRLPGRDAVQRVRDEIGRRRRFSDRTSFVDRRRGASSLVVLLAGHKDWLWPVTLARVARALPPDVDVCVVTPGRTNDALAAFAADNGWSHLTTQRGHVSVAQNIAISLHPQADRIFKVDEDIFVTPGFFAALGAGFDRVRAECQMEVGFCAPLLNVNAYSYADFVAALGLEDEWHERFGPLRRAPFEIAAQADGEAAVWLWDKGSPVDAVGAEFAAMAPSWSIVPMRYSIGAIVFERSLWSSMWGFAVDQPPPGLGDDEEELCQHCFRTARAIVVLHDLYAGHFSYGPQTTAMRDAYGGRLLEL